MWIFIVTGLVVAALLWREGFWVERLTPRREPTWFAYLFPLVMCLSMLFGTSIGRWPGTAQLLVVPIIFLAGSTVGLFVQVLWLRRQVENLSRECTDLKRAAAPPAS